MIRILRETIDVKQKYPTVPTREFIMIQVEPNQTSFSVLAGHNKRRIYHGSTNGEKIVSNYFDGCYAVLVCNKRTYIFGPGRLEKPEANWRLIRSFSTF